MRPTADDDSLPTLRYWIQTNDADGGHVAAQFHVTHAHPHKISPRSSVFKESANRNVSRPKERRWTPSASPMSPPPLSAIDRSDTHPTRWLNSTDGSQRVIPRQQMKYFRPTQVRLRDGPSADFLAFHSLSWIRWWAGQVQAPLTGSAALDQSWSGNNLVCWRHWQDSIGQGRPIESSWSFGCSVATWMTRFGESSGWLLASWWISVEKNYLSRWNRSWGEGERPMQLQLSASLNEQVHTRVTRVGEGNS